MEEKLNNSLKLIAKSTFIVFLGLLISKILSYAYRIIIAREFGAEVYGFFSISIMLVGWLYTFSCLGLSEGLLRFIPYYRNKNHGKISQIFRFSLISSSIAGLIAGFLMFFYADFIAIKIFHNSGLIPFFKLFSIAVPLSVITQIFLSSIRAFEKIAWYSFIVNILQNVVKVSVLLLFILFFKTSSSIGISYILGIVSMLFVAYFFCRYKIPELFLRKKHIKGINKELFLYSLPLIFSVVIASILGWIDTFFVGYFKTATDVGVYNVALPIAGILAFTPFLFMQLFFPLISREYSNKNLDLIKQLSKQVGKWIFLINLPLLVIFILFPGVIINLLFGSQYLAAETALIILSFGFFFISQADISRQLLNMAKKPHLGMIDIALAAVLNIVLNISLVPKLGFIGAALSTTISYFFYGFLLMIQSYYYLKIIPLRRKMLHVLISVIVSAFALLIIRSLIKINLVNISIAALFFFLFYFLLLFITKSLDKNDYLILNSVKNKLAGIKISNLFRQI